MSGRPERAAELADLSPFGSPVEAADLIGTILEASTEYSIVGMDLDGDIVLWNEGARRLYGWEPTDIVDKGSGEQLHTPEDVAAGLPRQMMRDALDHGKWEGVVTRQRRDGTTFMASVVLTPRRDASDRPVGFLLISRDISERLRLAEQLRATQRYTRSLIESNVDALMTTDPLGVVTDVNQQTEALTGRSRDELIGTPFKSHFTDPERAEDGIRLVLREGRVDNYELTARAGDGRETVVSCNATAYHDQDGRLQGVFAAARDITEQKQLEGRLREQQDYLRGLIESSADGLVIVDPEGLITDVNERMCRMSGYQRTELVGTPFADCFTEPDRATAGLERTFGAQTVTELALTLVTRGRRHMDVSLSASVFNDAAGRTRGVFFSARDVTDRMRLEDQLREQQTYLRGLIESSVDGLVTVDPEGFVTDVNEQMCRMTGRAREELLGSPFKDYFTDPERADLGTRRTLAEGLVTNYELVLTSPGSRRTTVSLNASVFRDAGGDAQGIFASARDISEQARLQARLAEQQSYNRSLVEASADALFVIAPDGVVTDVNEEAARLTRYSRKHLVGSRFAQYFTEAQAAAGGVEQTLRDGRVVDCELVLVTRGSRRVSVSVNAGVVADRDAQVLGILAAARETTAQKRLEQQLRESQVYTRSLFESSIDALVTTDPLGAITDVNEQMKRLTGREREDLVGLPFKECFTEPDRAEQGLRLTLQDGSVRDYELTVEGRDGARTVVVYNATTLHDREGRLQGVLAAARDVTDRKRFEQALQLKNVELERANQGKDRFLASMSHELRTPLNAVLGFTGTLLMGLAGPVNDEQRHQLQMVQSSAQHLLSIINDLLDLARLEEGKWQGDFRSVDCLEVVREVVGHLSPLFQEKGLRFEVPGPQEPATLVTDRRALSQILINLAGNAIKFTDQGEVRIEIRERRRNGASAITFDVVDTGIGIASEDQDKIFRAFEQVQRYGTAPHEGTGLGLYISQRLAGQLEGSITFESKRGEGTTFTLTLPSTPAPTRTSRRRSG